MGKNLTHDDDDFIVELSENELVDSESGDHLDVTSAEQDGEPVSSLESNKNNPKRESKKTSMDKIIDCIAKGVCANCRPSDSDSVASMVKEVIGTVMRLNELQWNQTGLVVKGELYRYEDYEAPSSLAKLLVAKRVVVAALPSAVDFLDRSRYQTNYGPLSPSDFSLKVRAISRKVRSNPTLVKLDRKSESLLAEASNLAINTGRVASRQQDTIYYLTAKFDDEARVNVLDWAIELGLRLFDGGQS